MPKVNRVASLVRYGKIHDLRWPRGFIVSSKNGQVKPDVEFSLRGDKIAPALLGHVH